MHQIYLIHGISASSQAPRKMKNGPVFSWAATQFLSEPLSGPRNTLPSTRFDNKNVFVFLFLPILIHELTNEI